MTPSVWARLHKLANDMRSPYSTLQSKQGKAVATKCIKETENGCAWNDFKDYDGNRGLVSNGVFKYPQDLAESKGGWQLNVYATSLRKGRALTCLHDSTNASDQQFRLNPSGIATQWKTWTKTCLSEKKYNHVSCRIPVNAKDGTTSTQYVYVDINLAKD